tara:strand:- start:102 stop:437 length:336 start_codon:yes stop_codon:yes gene_type:complete
MFSPTGYIDSKEHIKNFNKVAEKVSAKYKMERNDKWLPSNYRNKPNYFYAALQFGEVTLYAESKAHASPTGKYNGKIIHSIEMINGKLNHTLTYYSEDGLEYISEKTINDF